MSKVRSLLFSVVAVLALALTSVKAQEQTIVEIAAGNPDFSTLVELVTAAGLVDALSGEGPLTVFAPTNDAFAAVPASVLSFLAANPDALTAVLTYHVVPGAVLSTDLSDGLTAATLQGGELDFGVSEDGVKVDGVNVVAADITASNGVIHVVDGVLLPAFELPAVDPLAVSDNIIAAGSSTVYPVTERLADLFNQEGFAGTITVDSIGSGAGISRFCAGETDIANASRAIRESEVETCRAIGREPIVFFVGIDALTIVVSRENDFIDNITLEQAAAIFNGEITNWNQVDPSYPDAEIQKFAPGTDSGTFDFFVEAVLDNNREGILAAPGIQFSEDDNVLVAGVEGSPFAIGFFGSAYYFTNTDRLKALNFNGVAADFEGAESGEYELSRPLFVYTTADILAEKPQVAEFINFYLSNVDSQLGTDAGQIGYFPASKRNERLNVAVFLAAASGF